MLEPEKITYYMHTLDQRGEFLGLTNQGDWQEVNLVKTQAGQIRGNHFHVKINEFIFLLSGQVKVELWDCNDLNKKSSLILNAGEGIKITPYILHRFHYLEDSVHIQLLDTPFNSENQDLHTLIPDQV